MRPESINGAVSQDIQSIYARGMDSSACATGRPAFINLVTEGRNDPIAVFKKQPHQTDNAKKLVYYEAEKNLPADFLQKELSAEGNKIRTLIGVIYKDVQESGNAEDLAKLNKVCKKLAEANGNENKEQKVAKELSGLVSKYSAGAFEKVINKYIEHCMGAWEDHHQAKSVDTHDKAIFKQCLDVCKSTLKHDVEGLTKPDHDQPWETMAQKLNFFVNDCAAISKTLTFYDAEPVTPAPKGPETLNLNPDRGADNQQVSIPTGPGQGSITLNITNTGGSVGNISHSVDSAKAAPADSNPIMLKYILDSSLTDVDKVVLAKNFFNSINRGSSFLGNLEGVQAVKQEQAVDTQQLKLATEGSVTPTPTYELRNNETRTEGGAETDIVPDMIIGSESIVQQQPIIVVDHNNPETEIDGDPLVTQNRQDLPDSNLKTIGMIEENGASRRSSFSKPDNDNVDTPSPTIAPMNLTNASPAHFTSTKPDPKRGNVSELVAKFEAKRSASFDHLHKNGAVKPGGEKIKAAPEHDVEDSLTDSLIKPEPARPKWNGDSVANRTTTNIKMATQGADSTDGVLLRENVEQVKRKSGAADFQPARFTYAFGNKSGDNHVYTTVRTVSSWNRESKPVSFVPQESKSDSAELDAVFLKIKQSKNAESDATGNKNVKQDEDFNEFIARRVKQVTGHE